MTPIYEFKCECGNVKTISTSIVDRYIPECECGKTMKRVYTPPILSSAATPTKSTR